MFNHREYSALAVALFAFVPGASTGFGVSAGPSFFSIDAG